MRELTMYETDQTGGGAAVTALVALVGGFVGQLVLEELGGADGIEEGLSKICDLFTDNKTRKVICKNPLYSDSDYCS